jgi:hypothetical protein
LIDLSRIPHWGLSKYSGRALAAAAAGGALFLASSATAQASVSATPIGCAQPNARVSTIAIHGTTAYIGGKFTNVKDRSGRNWPRAHLAAIDTASCDLLPWQADTNNEVNALKVAGNTLFAGGAFTSVGASRRTYLAAFNVANGALTSFNHTLNKPVEALGAVQNRLYAGGAFTTVDGANRPKAAAFAVDTGQLDGTWKPTVSGGKVETIATSADRVYLGGSFTKVNGRTDVDYLAAVAPTSGAVDTSFLPHATFPMLALAVDSRGVYGGGAGSGGHMAMWNLSGALREPVYQVDGDVQAIAVDGDSVYAGGHFTNYCVGNTGSGAPYRCNVNLERRKLFEVSFSSGAVTSWNPSLNSPFGAIVAVVDSSHRLWVGGDFTTVGGRPVDHLAVFP